MHFNHRKSFDEDFFTTQSFRPEELQNILSKHFNTELISISKGTLHVKLDGTPCSFLYYPFKVLRKEIINNILVASVLDIAAMKLSAILSRGSKKDFVDLYIIMKSGITFDNIWQGYKEKFDVDDKFIYQIHKSLVYFSDAEKERLDLDIEKEWDNIKNYYITLVRKNQPF